MRGTGRRCTWTSSSSEIDGAVDRARNAGARLEGPVQTNNWGKIAMLADPFGHGICLIEFVGRGYDEIATEKAKGPSARRLRPA